MTMRASAIGLRTRVTPATAPARSVLPSMMLASSELVPSAVKTAPWPALKSGRSSMIVIAETTASRLLPPSARIA
jgi:hypothetical protein